MAMIVLFLSFPQFISAQGMMGRFFSGQTSTIDESTTAQDEAAGKLVFEKLQSNTTVCQNITDNDFDVLGDYYMAQMAGSTTAHAQMNARMSQMMGDSGEKQMHIALGKRLSGCNSGAPFSNDSNSGFIPMMGFGGMMGGNWNNASNLSWVSMLVFWLLVAVAIYGLIKWFSNQQNNKFTPLDILKKRYASGEISKKEFEEMKKDLI